MNAELLKSALILALNFGKADRLIDSICRVLAASDSPGSRLHDLLGALLMLDVDSQQIIRDYERNLADLAAYAAESAQAEIEELSRLAVDRRRNVLRHVEDEQLEREAA